MSTVLRDPRALAVRIGIGAALLLPFLWELDGALNNFLVIEGLAHAARAELSALAWIVLVLGFTVPVVAYVLGLVLGVRRTAGRFALVLVAAFCASEALTFSVLTLFQSAVGGG